MLSKKELDTIKKLEYETGYKFNDCYLELLRNKWVYKKAKQKLEECENGK